MSKRHAVFLFIAINLRPKEYFLRPEEILPKRLRNTLFRNSNINKYSHLESH